MPKHSNHRNIRWQYVRHLCEDDYPIYCTFGNLISQTFELLIGVHLTSMHPLQAYRHTSFAGVRLTRVHLRSRYLHPDIQATWPTGVLYGMGW